MQLRRLILMPLLIAGGLLAKVDPEIDRIFQQGNDAYQAENYAEAIRLYESIAAKGFDSGPLYFNLGNAYYRIGDVGQTILNYERAARRMPNDPNVAFNLRLANLSVKDKIDMPPAFFLFRWYERSVNLLSARGWALLLSALILITVSGVAVLLNVDLRRLRRFLKTFCLVTALLCLLVIVNFIQKYQSETAEDQGVILSETVSSLAAPQAGSTELFIIHEGTKVRLMDSDGNWIKIELIDGKQGWILQSDVAKI